MTFTTPRLHHKLHGILIYCRLGNRMHGRTAEPTIFSCVFDSCKWFALPAIVQEEGKLTTNSRWMMRLDCFADKLIVRSWDSSGWDIDNPDQRISDSAEQQLACRKTGLVHCIVTLSAKLCHSKCYLRFSNMMYILFSGFLSAVLLIWTWSILELRLIFVDARWCQLHSSFQTTASHVTNFWSLGFGL